MDFNSYSKLRAEKYKAYKESKTRLSLQSSPTSHQPATKLPRIDFTQDETIAGPSTSLPLCRYGTECYRKNDEHRQAYYHPSSLKLHPVLKQQQQQQQQHDMNNEQDLNQKCNLKLKKDATQSASTSSYRFGFYLFRVEGLQYGSMLTTTLSEILSEANGELVESAQFNYMFELDWLVEQYPIKFRTMPMLIVHGFKGAQEDAICRMSSQWKHVSSISAPLPIAYGTHHTKMMLLRYKVGLRIVIHTANMVESDWSYRTQGIWISPTLDPGSGDSKTRFKHDLIEYLSAYKTGSQIPPLMNAWIDIVRGHDFGPIKVWLIASVPGRFKSTQINSFGHPKMADILSKVSVPRTWPLIGQFSSIGSLGSDPTKWLTTEWSGSLAGKGARGIRLIYPTVEDVRQSLEGYQAGGCLPYAKQTAERQPWLRQFLHSWRGPTHLGAKISKAIPHIKSYLRCSPDGRQIGWFLLTSANLSKAAWGSFEIKKTQLMIRSYELGVLFTPENFQTNESTSEDKFLDDFPVPYCLPPVAYSESDKSWVFNERYLEKDSHGFSWIPS